MKKLFLAAIVLATGTAKLNAQAVATATASATIVAPIAISKTADMNFGNLAVSAAAGGVVTLEPSAAAIRTASGGGGVTFPAITGTVTAARFTVSGQSNYTFDIALPSGAILESGANSMFADNFTASAGAGTLNGSGTQVVYVGADLSVAASQTPGVYTTTTPFIVAVNYN